MDFLIYLVVVTVLTVQGVCGEEWGVTCKPYSICAFQRSSVDMSCSYTYPSHLTITQAYWTKLANRNPPDLAANPDYAGRIRVDCLHEAQRCSLHIYPVATSDSGAYYLRITASLGGKKWSRTSAVYLEVTEAPQTPLLSISPPGDIQEGSDVTLTCTSKSHLPVKSYYWYRTEGPTANTSLKYQGIAKSYSIKHIGVEDTGDYYCETRFQCGNLQSSAVYLPVYYPPKNTTAVTDHPLVIPEGSMVTLTCSSDANPPVENYTWFKVDQSTPVGSGQQYSISNISSEDAGQYYCEARNHYGFGNSSPVSISVTYRPRNTVVEIDPPGQITEGSRVTLTCSTDANPPAHTYSWYKTGTHVQLSSNEQLTFSQISSDDSGGYFCRAVSDNGQQDSPAVSVRVLYPPRNTRIESDSSGQVPVGATVTLTCTGEADPPAHTYTWIKKRGDVQLESGKEKTLTLSKIRPEDRGEYLCRVANEIGQQESPAVSVQVAYSPQNTKVLFSDPDGTTRGSTVTLTCSSDANPPVENYTWFKVDQSTPVGSGQQYSISNVRSDDLGQYYCEARNEHGAENASVVSILFKGKQSPVLTAVVAVLFRGVMFVLCVLILLGCSRTCRRGRARQSKYYEDTKDHVNVAPSETPDISQGDAVHQDMLPKTIPLYAVHHAGPEPQDHPAWCSLPEPEHHHHPSCCSLPGAEHDHHPNCCSLYSLPEPKPHDRPAWCSLCSLPDHPTQCNIPESIQCSLPEPEPQHQATQCSA